MRAVGCTLTMFEYINKGCKPDENFRRLLWQRVRPAEKQHEDALGEITGLGSIRERLRLVRLYSSVGLLPLTALCNAADWWWDPVAFEQTLERNEDGLRMRTGDVRDCNVTATSRASTSRS
jgi:hypothetical protein